MPKSYQLNGDQEALVKLLMGGSQARMDELEQQAQNVLRAAERRAEGFRAEKEALRAQQQAHLRGWLKEKGEDVHECSAVEVADGELVIHPPTPDALAALEEAKADAERKAKAEAARERARLKREEAAQAAREADEAAREAAKHEKPR